MVADEMMLGNALQHVGPFLSPLADGKKTRPYISLCENFQNSLGAIRIWAIVKGDRSFFLFGVASLIPTNGGHNVSPLCLTSRRNKDFCCIAQAGNCQ